jgi:anaerobic magnesium-protoporphyrin IX monomethyl ester cyclase
MKPPLQRSKLKIALVSLQKDAERVPPVGLVYLASFLTEKVRIPRENIKIIDKNFDDITSEILRFKPDLIGISAMTVQYQNAIELATGLKKMSPAPIIVGGVHISTLPSSLKKCFDVGVIGEGEQTLSELFELFLKKGDFNQKDLRRIKSVVYLDGSEIKINPQRENIDLETLPMPDFDFVHKDYFKKSEIPSLGKMGVKGFLLTSRGCPYRCEFCSTARFWGRMRLQSPKKVAGIMKMLLEKHQASYFQVMDDLFTVSAMRLNQIREALIEEGIFEKIEGIDSTARANLMNDALCQAMRAIKIKTINFGFESGSERVLKYLKAGSVSVEMNKNAIRLGVKYGFNVYGSLMYGSPTETIEDMNRTNEFIDFALKNGAKNIWSFVATPFPATPFWNIALERGTVNNNMNFNLLSHHNLKRPLLLDKNISTEEFRRVFLTGRRKLRKFKIFLIWNFFIKNPSQTFLMCIKEPKYWSERIYRQLMNQ